MKLTDRTTLRSTSAGALVTLLLIVGMILCIRGTQQVSHELLSQLRSEERDITTTQRLRWSGELIVSAGRGYLLSEDQHLLSRLDRAKIDFISTLEVLAEHRNSSATAELVSVVRTKANAFVQLQEELIASRHSSFARSIRRFEGELLPLQAALSGSLDRLVEQRELELAATYEHARRELHTLAMRMYAALAALVVVSVLLTCGFAMLGSRARASEQEALAVARNALASRDDLLNMLAHDLRSPLFAIKIKADELLRSAAAANVADHMHTISGSIGRMEGLITSILDGATLEAGRLSLHPVTCSVKSLVDDCMLVLRPLYMQKDRKSVV